ncbi:hypothetical protein SEA_FLOAT294_38 [Gordonia phage Float294]|uniref:Uncharacterized protein n=1 Tax=Gordonia phage Skysand TaxID=2301559 RepID=A0A385DTT3_9CAUD|nr:virion structural protein [Gordonia phage Skysand]AXQ62072.1 hypothetical protein SEA_SKYSAND_38 [Gordonia phage Skysand]QXN74421.1 hypothetical protein SEA_FLOAT294_38 [Gordonia phage Float294]
MSFNPVKLVHPKTGIVVTATTAVDLTNFRFNDGYVPVDTAKLLVGAEGGEEKYPKLVEGLKVVEEIEAAERGDKAPADEAPADVDKPGETADKADDAKSTETEVASTTSKTTRGAKGSTAAKSGTDASGQQVGVN